jgi:hypothetical protein|eukprot:COSAG01_NODE_147_length_24095_cov_25.855428_24_plen_53_part_00
MLPILHLFADQVLLIFHVSEIFEKFSMVRTVLPVQHFYSPVALRYPLSTLQV